MSKRLKFKVWGPSDVLEKSYDFPLRSFLTPVLRPKASGFGPRASSYGTYAYNNLCYMHSSHKKPWNVKLDSKPVHYGQLGVHQCTMSNQVYTSALWAIRCTSVHYGQSGVHQCTALWARMLFLACLESKPPLNFFSLTFLCKIIKFLVSIEASFYKDSKSVPTFPISTT